MKNTKYYLSGLLVLLLMSGCTYNEEQLTGMPNPWINCGTNQECISNKAGFGFDLNVLNYSSRAMQDMAEVTFKYKSNNKITVRKSAITQIGDISGDYNDYPEIVVFEYNDIYFNLRCDGEKIYVANFEDFEHDYSIASKKGLTIDEIKDIYSMIKSVDGNSKI